MESVSLRAEYCCCCVRSDGQGSPGSCTEASGGRQASCSQAEEAAGGCEGCCPRRRPAAAGGKVGRPCIQQGAEAAAAAGGSKSGKAAPASSRVSEAAKAARGLPPPGKRVADFATDISVDDYLVGKPLARFFCNLLIRRRVGRRPTCCCSACRGDHGGCRGAKGEGWCS